MCPCRPVAQYLGGGVYCWTICTFASQFSKLIFPLVMHPNLNPFRIFLTTWPNLTSVFWFASAAFLYSPFQHFKYTVSIRTACHASCNPAFDAASSSMISTGWKPSPTQRKWVGDNSLTRGFLWGILQGGGVLLEVTHVIGIRLIAEAPRTSCFFLSWAFLS